MISINAPTTPKDAASVAVAITCINRADYTETINNITGIQLFLIYLTYSINE